MQKITLKIFKPVLYTIIIIVTALVVFSAIKIDGIYNDYLWKKHTRELAQAKLVGDVNKMQKIILSIEQIPLNLAYVLEFSNPTYEEMDILIKSIVTNDNDIFGVCIAFEPGKYNKDTTYYAPYYYRKNGKIIIADPTDTTDHYFSQDWYLIPKILDKPVWIEPYFDEGSEGGNIVLSTYSVPFYSFDGTNETMDGIIAVDISIEWLSKIISSINLLDGSFSILVSENGTIISASNPQWAYNESIFSLAEEHHLPKLRDLGRNLQKGKSGFVEIGKLGKRKNWYVYYMPIPANNWGVLLFVPED